MTLLLALVQFLVIVGLLLGFGWAIVRIFRVL